MTPQLRQAIQLLQYSNIEVTTFVERELERNPLLERDDISDSPIGERAALDQISLRADIPADTATAARAETLTPEAAAPLDNVHADDYDRGGSADGGPSMGSFEGRGGNLSFSGDDRTIEDMADERPPLREHLGAQLRMSFTDPVDRMIGAHLIALLCPAGRLTADPAAIAQAMGLDLERVEAVRGIMLQFDPPGLFARDLKECLAAQLADKNRLDPAMRALLDNLDMLARRDLRGLLKVCGVDSEDLADMITELKALDPKPGASFDDEPVRAVVPDLLMRAVPGDAWIIELNPDTMPRVLVNEGFHARVAPKASKADRVVLADYLASANWLVRSLQQRAQTILKVSGEIMRLQDGFLRQGVSHLRPLILRDIAAAVEMHESTVSRVTSNKYIATPRGMFELKYFFTTTIGAVNGGEGHSSEAVRHRIRRLIEAEAADSILSDDQLVTILHKEGVDIARRTVAKYREAMHIPNSVGRRRVKAVPA